MDGSAVRAPMKGHQQPFVLSTNFSKQKARQIGGPETQWDARQS
jgi:hypothetical protein